MFLNNLKSPHQIFHEEGILFYPQIFEGEELERLRAIDPGALAAFTAKVQATQRVAAGGGAVGFRLTTDWDRKRFPASPDLVAFEVTSSVQPERWIGVVLDDRLPSPAGPATPGKPQSYMLQVEPAFFINGFWCKAECDGDARNPLEMRAPVQIKDFASALKVSDVTSGEKAVSRPTTPRRRDFEPDASSLLTLEEAGYESQPPDRRYQVIVAPTLTSEDGQRLGYRWLGLVGNWHMRAFSSFGDGHGVWERSGGALLPFYARKNMRWCSYGELVYGWLIENRAPHTNWHTA